MGLKARQSCAGCARRSRQIALLRDALDEAKAMESVRVQAHNHEVRLLERRIATKMEATDFLRRQVDLIANGGDR